jgi:osmotically-inducible protein OsmY
MAGRRGITMTGRDLRASVAAELGWDPKVDSGQIAVSADGGAVTLRGAVSSLRQKREARNATRRVGGVTSVSNQLQVRIPDADRRADAGLRADVLHAFMLDSLIPATVDAGVRDGLVTLTGTAGWQYQRGEAELVCASVPGVLGIEDEITLASAPGDGDIQMAISAAFARSAGLDANCLSVDIPADGMVVLSGAVSSWAEHDEAIATAWSAPGITRLDVRITVMQW